MTVPKLPGTLSGTSRGWLRAGAAAPPPRRQRSVWVRVLVALTSTTAVLATAAVVAAAAVVPPIGARRTARDAALREIGAQVLPGEHIVAQVFASQRRWTDMWRESFGVVAPRIGAAVRGRAAHATAAPPTMARWNCSSRASVRRRVHAGAPHHLARTGTRTVLRTPAAQVDFIVDDGSWIDAQRVAWKAPGTRRGLAGNRTARRHAARAGTGGRRIRLSHRETRRDAHGLARRFQTSPDVLRQLNQLTQDDIKVGQRLRVLKVEADSVEQRRNRGWFRFEVNRRRRSCVTRRVTGTHARWFTPNRIHNPQPVIHHPNTIANTSGATMPASLSMMYFGVSMPASPT